MRAIAQGALLLSLLPVEGRGVTAGVLAAQLRAHGVHKHVRSIQRDLESLPASLVERNNVRKPFEWRRADQHKGDARRPDNEGKGNGQ